MSFLTQMLVANGMWVPALRRQLGLWPFEPPLPGDWDPQGHLKADGEWHAVIRLPHEIVEWEGYGVPLYEGDLERREWEARR